MLAGPRDNVREKATAYSKPLEVVMVDGPLYLNSRRYYVAEFVKPDSMVAASLVYDDQTGSFTSDPETIRKVLAAKDLKKLTVADPLFFASGDPSKIILASKYETQNVRNFASFSSITPEERNILEIFLNDYEDVMENVANTSAITQRILYPNQALLINYVLSPPSMEIRLNKQGGEHFSYELFEELVASYQSLYQEYRKLSADLSAFAGELPEYPPGAVIREKWEIQMTRESILEEVGLIEENGNQIKKDIELRQDILQYPFTAQIDEAQKRLGVTPHPRTGFASIFARILSSIKGFFAIFLGIGAFLILFGRDKRPGQGLLPLLLAVTILLGLISSPLTIGAQTVAIPTMQDIISQKIEIGERIQYRNLAEGLEDAVVEDLLNGFRLVLKGETVEVSGPYLYYQKPYYFFDIQKDGASTGYGFLVDAESLRLVGDQRQAYQLLKTLLFSKLLVESPLYIGENPDLVERKSRETLESPLDLFLTNLSANMRRGAELEKKIIESPDFETLLELTERYVEAFILIQNINQLVSEKDAEILTGGFSRKLYLLDAYSRATRGLSSQEFLQGRSAQYRGRTLNRLPLIEELSFMGMNPSKAQVAHDLASDLIYDNTYIWRKGRVANPALFARLSFKEGTFTLPESTL